MILTTEQLEAAKVFAEELKEKVVTVKIKTNMQT